MGKRTLMGTGTDQAPIPKGRQENLTEPRKDSGHPVFWGSAVNPRSKGRATNLSSLRGGSMIL